MMWEDKNNELRKRENKCVQEEYDIVTYTLSKLWVVRLKFETAFEIWNF